MVEVPFDFLDPFGKNPVNTIRIRKIEPPIRKFSPNNVSLLIAIIKKAFFKNFFMQPCAVKSHRHRTFDIREQRLIVRRGINSVGIKTLIENEPLENRGFIDKKPISVKTYIS